MADYVSEYDGPARVRLPDDEELDVEARFTSTPPEDLQQGGWAGVVHSVHAGRIMRAGEVVLVLPDGGEGRIGIVRELAGVAYFAGLGPPPK